MHFFDLDTIVAETRKENASEFEKRHPQVAIVIERFVPAPENATNDDPTWADTFTDREQHEKPDADANLRPLKLGLRGFWLDVGPHPEESDVRIGRDAANQISLPNPRISRHHATLRYSRGARAWFVADEGSANGTTVNGKPVRMARVGDGDFVVLGQVAVLRPYFNPGVFYRRLREADESSGPKLGRTP